MYICCASLLTYSRLNSDTDCIGIHLPVLPGRLRIFKCVVNGYSQWVTMVWQRHELWWIAGYLTPKDNHIMVAIYSHLIECWLLANCVNSWFGVFAPRLAYPLRIWFVFHSSNIPEWRGKVNEHCYSSCVGFSSGFRFTTNESGRGWLTFAAAPSSTLLIYRSGGEKSIGAFAHLW